MHLCAIIPFILYGEIYTPLYGLYCSIITASTCISIQLHRKYLDVATYLILRCSMDGIWFAFDVFLTYKLYGTDIFLLLLQTHNLVTFLQIFVGSPTSDNYVLRQSMWNIASAAKCVAVSYGILSKR